MVNNTIGQRHLRPDNHQVDALLPGYFSQPLNVIGFNIQVPGNPGCTGITQRGVNLLNPGTLGQLPDQGMLSGPAANNKDFYLPHPLNTSPFIIIS